MSLQAAIVVGVILLVQALFRKCLAPRWRCALWLLLAARLLLPFSFGSAVSIFNLSALRHWMPEKSLLAPFATDETAFQIEPRTEVTVPANLSPAFAPAAASRPRSVPKPANPWYSSPRLWTWVWLAGFVGFLAQVSFRSARWRARFSGSPRVFAAPIVDLVDECAERLGLRRRLAVFESVSVSSPILYGVIKPRIVFPEGFIARFHREEIRFVILHEMVHLKNGDLVLNWLTTLLQAVHWFNPLVWFGFERWRADRELACDAVVLKTVGAARKRDYGETIIQLLEGQTYRAAVPGHVGVSAAPGELRSRLAMIGAFEPASRWSALALLLVGGVGLACLTNAPAERRESVAASLVVKIKSLDPVPPAIARPEFVPSPTRYLEKAAPQTSRQSPPTQENFVAAARLPATTAAWHDTIKSEIARSRIVPPPVVPTVERPRVSPADLVAFPKRDSLDASPGEMPGDTTAEPSPAQDIRVDVVVDLTDAGRKIVRPTPGHPAYYLPLTAGYKELGAFVPNQVPPPNLKVQHRLARALYNQGYRVTSPSKPPSLVLVFWWGHLAPEISSSEIGAPVSHSDAFHRTGFFGSDWEATLAELPSGQSANERLMVSLVAGNTRDYQSTTDNPSAKLEEILTMEKSPRHFLIMAAFDFQDWARHRKTLLWQAHISTEMADRSLAEVLPTLVTTAAPMFGCETTSPQLITTFAGPVGRVIVGVPTVRSNPAGTRPDVRGHPGALANGISPPSLFP